MVIPEEREIYLSATMRNKKYQAKHCYNCGEQLTNENWHKGCQKIKKNICKKCETKIWKEYYLENKEMIKRRNRGYYQNNNETLCKNRKKSLEWCKKFPEKHENSRLKRIYGITLEEYNNFFKRQKGCCAICGKHQSVLKSALCVDHNHKTGKIRGLICRTCNFGLGYLENQEFSINAKKYLEDKK